MYLCWKVVGGFLGSGTTLAQCWSTFTEVTTTSSLHVISCLIGSDCHVPNAHVPLSFLTRKTLNLPNSNPIIFENKVKFSSFFIAWSKMLCCGPNFSEVVSKNYQVAKTGRLSPAQMNQAAMLDFLTKWGCSQGTHGICVSYSAENDNFNQFVLWIMF